MSDRWPMIESKIEPIFVLVRADWLPMDGGREVGTTAAYKMELRSQTEDFNKTWITRDSDGDDTYIVYSSQVHSFER
jgi:hypothetical protein